MIFSQEITEAIDKLFEWAVRDGVTSHAEGILASSAYRLMRVQLSAQEDTDSLRTFVREVLNTADSYGYGQEAETALRATGYGQYIAPTSGVFDVSFAGVTLRLTLPIDRNGEPVDFTLALNEAMRDATVTPVVDTEDSATDDTSAVVAQ